jgi:uncharacterized cupin superfamily protein
VEDALYALEVVPEAPLAQTQTGLMSTGDGWFVLNAREARWLHRQGHSASCEFEGEKEFRQIGIFLRVLVPGAPMAMYHWEADQEGFLVLSGKALLIIEGKERPLQQWDFVHCPPETNHVIIGAGDVPCLVLAVGAREHQGAPGWGGYTVDKLALRHGAGVEEETADAKEAYARFPKYEPTRYQDGWLPDM